MNKGYLVSFEGQDASGKSALLHRVDNQLRKRGYKTKVVEEFSASEMGESLRKKLTQDKFLRFGEPLPTAFAETMRVVADLYYQDELEISPAIAEGKVVLKERHIDTIFACQIPKIRCDYPEANFADLWTWVKELTRNLYIPHLTFLLSLPRIVQVARIKGRGETASGDDLRIFEERDRIYSRLAKEHKDRIVIFDNNKSVQKATDEIAVYMLNVIHQCQ